MKLKTLNKKLALSAFGAALFAATSPLMAGTAMDDKAPKEVVVEEAEPWLTGELSAGWDSLYMFRGVNILDGDPLAWSNISLSAWGFTGGAWYALSTEGAGEYSELDLFLGYTYEIGPVALEAGGIWYYFPEAPSSSDDTYELYAGISYSPLDWLKASLYYYYDFELFQASYLQAKLEGSFPVTGAISIDPWVAAAVGDYNSGDSWVYDHTEAGVALNVALNDHVSIKGYGAYSRAGEGTRASASTSEDEFWGGASVAFSF